MTMSVFEYWRCTLTRPASLPMLRPLTDFFFLKDPPPPESSPLPLHAPLPISSAHTRIETIASTAGGVRARPPPRARVAVAHGQLKEAELDAVMARFVRGEVDVLVSTMIVESGLDVPNANTMLVSRADQFGLAQLYQLRGRVGRSHRRAYCYLLVPDVIDPDAEERLRVLEHHTDLGSGYRIALRELELRGCRNLLGAAQAGHAQAVGVDTHLRRLQGTLDALKAGKGDEGAGRGGPPE